MKNIIMIDVDALMPSRLGIFGNIDSVSPTLDQLAKTSLNCTNAFSMGNPTEFALPGLFASAYLLDANGFRYGISDNQTTFSETLKEHGYSTAAFMTAFRPKNDKYDRGFDDFYNLIDIQVTEKNLLNTAKWYREQYHNSKSLIPQNECIEDMIEYYNEYLNDMILYCDNWENYMTGPIVENSSIFDNVNYDAVRKKVLKDKITFREDETNYICSYFSGSDLGITGIANEINIDRDKKVTSTLMDIVIRFSLLLNIFVFFRKASSFRASKNIIGHVLSLVKTGRKNIFNRYATGQYILNTFANWLTYNREEKKPFFAYMKLMDAHEMNIYSHDVQDKSTNKRELLNAQEFFKSVGKSKKYTGNVLYDCSIRYSDEIIKKILDLLKERGILDETIVVITADHGGQFPNIPVRDSEVHRVDSFVDELYRIPLIFYNTKIKAEEYKGLVSSVDINTTLLDMVGIDSPSTFRGGSILSQGFERDHVLFENQGRGPCHLKYKPIKICVRTKSKKIVYERQPNIGNRGVVIEAFDLSADPEEFINLSSNKDFISTCTRLIKIAELRVTEILK
ncbi:sulfatase-like hydrolase/transferase [Pseudomonadales bacterium]|nr:sulfatase-like hydrolase/transferase [Pseudomonadales bacterium]